MSRDTSSGSFMSFNETFNAVRLTLLSNGKVVPIIVGERGIGKTALALKIAEEFDMNYTHIDGNLLKEGEVGGLPTLQDVNVVEEDFMTYCKKLYVRGRKAETAQDTVKLFKFFMKKYREVSASTQTRKVTVYGTFHALEKCHKWYQENPKKKTLLFIDELNRCEHAVQQELMNLILNREINGFVLPENVIIMAASNPSNKYSLFKDVDYQVVDLDPAQEDRLRWFFMGSDVENWISWAMGIIDEETGETRIDPEIVEYISINPDALDQPYSTEDVKSSPRSWERVSITKRNFKEHKGFNKRDFYNCIKGDIGTYQAISFTQYINENANPAIKPEEIFERGYEQLPEEIENKLSNEPPIRQSFIMRNCIRYMLTHKKDKKSMSLFIECINTLPKELMVSIMITILNEHRDFHNKLVAFEEYLNAFHETDQLVD